MKGVAAWSRRLDGTEHAVRHLHELAELREILADQREVVPVIELADRPDPLDAVLVAELATEGVAGVRRIGDHSTLPHDVGDLRDRATLRVGRMDVEVPGHAKSVELDLRAHHPRPPRALPVAGPVPSHGCATFGV